MNIKDLHSADKGVSAIPVFKSELGNVISIRLLKGEELKEHITKVKAFLVCIEGEVIFENEKGEYHQLMAGDYVHIEEFVKHKVNAKLESQLILVK
jgi:quercetin dioxygenase-like cupin family protein